MVRPVIRVPYAEEQAASLEQSSLGNRSAKDFQLMSKIPSLVFDMEDTEDAHHANGNGKTIVDEPIADVVQKLRSLLEPRSEPEYMVLLHVRIAMEEASKRGEAHLTPVELADTLRRLGYPVKLRTALGGGWGGACLRNLRHSFLAVALDGPASAESPLIVDPRFREQFEIAHATPRYQQILEAISPEAVVPQDRLNAAVEILAQEMASAFQSTGVPLPPWRQQAAMMSKWEPRRSEEVDVSQQLNDTEGDVTAFNNNDIMNNGVGHGGVVTRKALATKNTIAQKLAMLGIEQPGPPSPISEGLEDIEYDAWGSSSTTTGGGSPVPGGSPNTGTSPRTVQPWTDTGFNNTNNLLFNGQQGRNNSTNLNDRGQEVWEGIKAAVASMPTRRNTWA